MRKVIANCVSKIISYLQEIANPFREFLIAKSYLKQMLIVAKNVYKSSTWNKIFLVKVCLLYVYRLTGKIKNYVGNAKTMP
jgi:hypothetical protein